MEWWSNAIADFGLRNADCRLRKSNWRIGSGVLSLHILDWGEGGVLNIWHLFGICDLEFVILFLGGLRF